MPYSIKQRPVVPGALTVAMVDGLPLFRDGLTALVQRTPGLRMVGAAERANTALRLCERFRPDVLVIDSGIDPRNHLSSMLLGGDPALALLVLITEQHRSIRYLAGALAVGVQGVILRSAEPAQLVDAIRAVHADRRYVDPALTSVLAAPRGRPAGLAAAPLSRREYQVLQLIADGLENQAIAKILFVSVETVRTHVKSILRKLAARDRTHAIAVAFRSGLLTAEDGRPQPLTHGVPAPNQEGTAGAGRRA
jgi:DNA-binding NarL/FixJ family response regulator